MKHIKLLLLIFNLVVLSTFSQSPTYIPQNGLICWYPFNGNSNDESGNNNHGTVQGSVVLSPDRFGNPSSSYSFPGLTDSYIDVNHNSSFSNFQEGITVSLWYTYTNNSSNSRVLQIGSTDNNQKGFQIGVNNGLNQWDGFISNPPSGLGVGPNNDSVLLDVWTHLVMTFNFTTGNSKLYINGVLINDNNPEDWVNNFGTVDLSDVIFNIGRKISPSYDSWKGNIDDIGIWSRPLTSQEVSQLFLNNSFPTNISLSNTMIDENSIIGTEVGIFTSTDVDSGDTHTYSLVSGDGDTDNNSFTISGDKLLSSEVFDFETKNNYTIRVQTDDGNGGVYSKSFIININDLSEDFIPQNGLICWYPFNGNSNDESGNNNHGTVQGSVVLSPDRFGNPSSSYSFPGLTDSYIDVNHNSSFSNFQEGITVSLWYTYTNNSSNSRVLQIGSTDNNQKGFQIGVNNGLNQWDGFISNPPSGLGVGPNNDSVLLDVWTHLVMTFNFTTGNSKLYINGVLINDNNPEDWVNNFGTVDLSDVIFNIGRKISPSYDSWKGNIDDIGIWSRPLTSQEVTQLYSGSTLGTNKFVESKNEIKLYPNPTYDVLTIDSKIPLTKVEIYSILGKKVEEVSSDFKTISTDNLSSGMYILKIHSEKGITDKKLIKN